MYKIYIATFLVVRDIVAGLFFGRVIITTPSTASAGVGRVNWSLSCSGVCWHATATLFKILHNDVTYWVMLRMLVLYWEGGLLFGKRTMKKNKRHNSAAAVPASTVSTAVQDRIHQMR